jgi:serine/threonine protein kinase
MSAEHRAILSAHVCEARHTKLGKRVALKVLRLGPGSTSSTAARLVREGRAAAAVRHPNIVDVFELGEEEGLPYCGGRFGRERCARTELAGGHQIDRRRSQ